MSTNSEIKYIRVYEECYFVHRQNLEIIKAKGNNCNINVISNELFEQKIQEALNEGYHLIGEPKLTLCANDKTSYFQKFEKFEKNK